MLGAASHFTGPQPHIAGPLRALCPVTALAVPGLSTASRRSAALQANSHTRFVMVTDDSLWHYVTSVNNQPQSLSLAVACAELGVSAGSRYVVTEVSGARYGARSCQSCSHVPCIQ